MPSAVVTWSLVTVGPAGLTPVPYLAKYACVAGFVAARNCGVTTHADRLSELRIPMYSRLEKKWTLSLTIGPPRL
jgi:hypothetical protein